MWPGIAATLVLWLASGYTFGRYLSDFSSAYVTYYAGLASVVAALIFLYFSACIFIYGGNSMRRSSGCGCMPRRCRSGCTMKRIDLDELK